MGQSFYPNWAVSDLNAEFPHKASEACYVGDFLWYDVANHCLRPANVFADAGAAAATQSGFAALFAGVSNSQQLATDLVAENCRAVIDRIFEVPCVSSAFGYGDYVAPNYAAGLNPQLLVRVTDPSLSIGRAVKEYQAPTTQVKCRLTASALLGRLLLAGSTFASSAQTAFGAAAAGPFSSFSEEGNLYRNVGNPIAGNLADTTDDVLDGIVIPAGAFDVKGRGLTISFAGRFAANGNNKRVKIWVNPTMAGQTVTSGVISGGTVTGAGTGALLLDSAVQVGNNVGWEMLINFFKYGALGSNTQKMAGAQTMFGATHGGTTLAIAVAQPENAAMNFVVTGSSPTTGAANDVLLDWSEVNAMN